MSFIIDYCLRSLALTCAIAVLLAERAMAVYVPVFGGPEYNSATGNGYRDATFGQPAPRHLVNNNGAAAGSVSKTVSGTYQGRRAIQWSSSGAPAIEMITPARFGSPTDQWAYAINDNGTVVGVTYNDRWGERPMRWDATGAPTELEIFGTRDGYFTWGQAYAINNTGITVGYTDRWDTQGTNSNYVDRAARWDVSGAITELGDLSPGSIRLPRTRAFAVNESGTAVGYAQVLAEGVLDRGTRAVRWDGSGTAATELGNLGLSAGRTDSEAFDVNESGAAVGWARKGGGTSGFIRPVRWDANNTTATELDAFGLPSPSFAYAINDLGTAVGVAGGSAVRWDASSTAAVELENLGGGSRANEINNSGIAVGYANQFINGIFVGRRAVAWRPDTRAIDLNDLIDPQSGWTLSEAYSISDTGWITGSGLFDPDGPGGLAVYNRLFLLQLPDVPEPTTLLSAFITAACFITLRTQRVRVSLV
jgi:hypothetical protein